MIENNNTILCLNTLIKDDNTEMHQVTLDCLVQKDATSLLSQVPQTGGMLSQLTSLQGNDQQASSLPMTSSSVDINNGTPYPPVLTKRQSDMIFAANIQMARDQYKHSLRMEENKQKAELKEQAENRRTEKARKKEFEQSLICEDAEGYLRIQSRIPDEKDLLSGKIFHERNIKLFNIVSSEPICKMQIVTWDGLKSFILLVGKECSDRGLSKKLSENGVSPSFGRDKNRQIMKLVYAYLVTHADDCKIKRYFGWCKTDRGWEFAAEGEMTVQGILDKHMSKREG